MKLRILRSIEPGNARRAVRARFWLTLAVAAAAAAVIPVLHL